MKILMVIDNLGSGGAQRQLVTLGVGLKKRGYDVTFFIYYPSYFFRPQLVDNNIPIILAEKKNRVGLNIVTELRAMLSKGDFDFAISYLVTPNVYLSLSKSLSRTNTKIITSERTSTDLTKTSLFSRMRVWAHKKADHVVFNSNHERVKWVAKYRFLSTKSSTIYNGVDTETFNLTNIGYKRKNVLLGIGTITPDKNIHVFIQAIKILKEAGNPIQVKWYGKYIKHLPKSNDYYEYVAALVKEQEIDDLWEWLSPSTDINEVMKNYDALVLPSIVEGFPNVACEALASGLPVIISDTLDHPIIVKANERGFLFDTTDPNDLAKQIIKLYELNDDEYNSMKHHCRAFAATELSTEKLELKYIALFERLNGSGGQSKMVALAQESKKTI